MTSTKAKAWPLGQLVTFRATLERRTCPAEGWRNRKEWRRTEHPPRAGVYIGWRTTVDGWREYEDEVGYAFWPDKSTRRPAALVVSDARRSPVLVLFDDMEPRT